VTAAIRRNTRNTREHGVEHPELFRTQCAIAPLRPLIASLRATTTRYAVIVLDVASIALAGAVHEPVAPPRPSLVRALAVRFGLLYSVLFFLPIIAFFIHGTKWLGPLLEPVWRAVVGWVARGVLGIDRELTWYSGSGDKTVDWIWLLCCAAIALVSAATWSLVDRTRAHDERIRDLLRTVIRYCLAFTMLRYGISKLFISQFPAPSGIRLLQPYGDSSPMGLLWTFMGASPAYVFFSGAAETVGALLLLARRTTTLGALVLGAVLVNVVMMNLCYDVPVKIHSSHYLAMCVFLIAPDAAGLVRFLVLRRPAQPVDHALVVRTRGLRVAHRVLKYGASACLILAAVHYYADRRPGQEPDAWYEGSWKVTGFTRDGQDVPTGVADARRWSRIRFQIAPPSRYVRWVFMDGSYGELYTFTIDDQARTMTLAPAAAVRTPKQGAGPMVLHYVRRDADHLALDGTIDGATLAVELERFDPRTTQLMSRGFHWINEEPFNR
jgi:uncharacterized membrane protein YphA (DoxX/SURF4 family)